MRKVIGGIVIGLTLIGRSVSADEVTIAALGDSLTQGYGLPQQDGFVPQLQSWLADQGAVVEVNNAGVSGDTTAGGLSRVDWTLTPEVDVMIVALGGNDLLRGIDPANSRANLEAILQAAATADVPVLLVGMQAPGNFGPEYKASFDGIYPDLAAQFGALLAPDFFEGLRMEDGDPASVRAYMQADGIHPNREGVARIVAALGPRVLELILRAELQPVPGRVFLTSPMADLGAALKVDATPVMDEPARRNIAPGQQIVTLTADGLTRMRWGIVPVGRVNARGRPVMETIVNARSETVFDKSAYAGTGRAVVPVNGWYEWTGEKRRKTAWAITSMSDPFLYFAAITDIWRAPDGTALPQVARLTCAPSADVRDIHHRMGVIVRSDDIDLWLSGPEAMVQRLFQPWPDGSLQVRPAEDVDWTAA